MNSRWIGIVLGSSIAIVPVLASPIQAKSVPLVQLFPALEGIQLTSQQQSQLGQLTTQTLPRIKSLLSPQQLKQFNADLSAGKSVRVAILALDLTRSQKLKLNNELRTVKSKVERILDQEQLQQFTQNARAINNH
jgi:hypothetical protein